MSYVLQYVAKIAVYEIFQVSRKHFKLFNDIRNGQKNFFRQFHKININL